MDFWFAVGGVATGGFIIGWVVGRHLLLHQIVNKMSDEEFVANEAKRR